MLSITIAKLCEEHVYVFFCQMPKTKASSGAFQKGADVGSNRRQGHVALHHFETAHSCECIGHYKKRHTHAPQTRPASRGLSRGGRAVWRFLSARGGLTLSFL